MNPAVLQIHTDAQTTDFNQLSTEYQREIALAYLKENPNALTTAISHKAVFANVDEVVRLALGFQLDDQAYDIQDALADSIVDALAIDLADYYEQETLQFDDEMMAYSRCINRASPTRAYYG